MISQSLRLNEKVNSNKRRSNFARFFSKVCLATVLARNLAVGGVEIVPTRLDCENLPNPASRIPVPTTERECRSKFDFRNMCELLQAGTLTETLAQSNSRDLTQDSHLPNSLRSPSETTQTCKNQCNEMSNFLTGMCLVRVRRLAGGGAISSAPVNQGNINLLRDVEETRGRVITAIQRHRTQLRAGDFERADPDETFFDRLMQRCRYRSHHVTPAARVRDGLTMFDIRVEETGVRATTPSEMCQMIRDVRTLAEACDHSVIEEGIQNVEAVGVPHGLTRLGRAALEFFHLYGGLHGGPAGTSVPQSRPFETRLRRAQVFEAASRQFGLPATAINNCADLRCRAVENMALPARYQEVRHLREELCPTPGETRHSNGSRGSGNASDAPPENGNNNDH